MRRIARCAVLALLALILAVPLTAQTATLTAADSADLTMTLLRRAVQNGMRTAHAPGVRELVCVGFSGAELTDIHIRQLQDSTSLLVRPASACRTAGITSGDRGPLVYDTLTRKRGLRVHAAFPELNADGSFSVIMSYYEGSLSAAGWTCFGRRREQGGWEVTSCRLDVIS